MEQEHVQTETPNFIFVGGIARSGTSLVQKILDLHSAIYAGPEMGILIDLMGTYRHLKLAIRDGKLSMVVSEDSARWAYRLFLRALYRDKLAERSYGLISEKTPWNLLVFDALAEVFPEAKFIWVIRDPRDVLCSLRSVQERSRTKGVKVDAGRWLHEELRSMRRLLAAGEAFRRAFGERLHVVYYEDLLAEPRRVAESLCQFIGVDFEETMLATEQPNDTSKAIASKRRTQGVFYTLEMFDRPIDAANTGRWMGELDVWMVRAVETHLGWEPLPCLERYSIGRPAWPWRAAFSVLEPTTKAVRMVARQIDR